MKHIESLLQRYPSLFDLKNDLIGAFETLRKTYEQGGKLLICGNGGSSADAEHIVGELMKDFCVTRKIPSDFAEKLDKITENEAVKVGLRRALPAISLCSHTALMTALMNDGDPALVFAQQVYALGKPADTLLALSTSGNSANVVRSAEVAKALDMQVIAITGEKGGALAKLADIVLALPETETYKVQELTLPIYHTLCLMLEEHFFAKN